MINLERDGTDTVLTSIELDALLSVQSQFLKEHGGNPEYGSCLLVGRSYGGQECRQLLSFDLPRGAYHRNFFRIVERTSRQMVAESVSEMRRCDQLNSRFYPTFREQHGNRIASGIYRDGELLVAVLNCTRGQFFFAPNIRYRPDEACWDVDLCLIHATAEALALIAREDNALQRSTVQLLQTSSAERASLVASAVAAVRQYFSLSSGLPETRTLHLWRKKMGYDKEPRIFFSREQKSQKASNESNK